jgi:predicted RNase H-like nuclease
MNTTNTTGHRKAFDDVVFLGIDLGWYGKPSGLASIGMDGRSLDLKDLTRVGNATEALRWIDTQTANRSAVVAVDAPLVISNQTGIRDAERELSREFSRFHAACHATNLGSAFAQNVLAFSQGLADLGFRHGPDITPHQKGQFQIEVYPHAATVNLFDLARIVKYKKGLRETRGEELHRLRELMLARLPQLNPALSLQLPLIPSKGNLKSAEDQIDAVLCAYIAAHWWFWAKERNRVYGSRTAGYIVVPERKTAAHTSAV